MLNITFALAANTADFKERASTAGVVFLQGMLTIFAVLAVLWAAIEIMHLLLHKGEKKPKKVPSATKIDTPFPKVDGAARTAALDAREDDGAVVAAITAAITAMRVEQGHTGEFRVVSFKRINASNHRNLN